MTDPLIPRLRATIDEWRERAKTDARYGVSQSMKGEFTLVIGAIEQGDRISPPDAFATAVDRSNAVNAGQGKVCDHDF